MRGGDASLEGSIPRWARHLAAGVLLALSGVSAAASRVEAVGLFPDKAVLLIDGTRVVLDAGEASGGVTLVEADTDHALVRVDGHLRRLTLSHSVGGRYAEPDRREVRISRDNSGMYSAPGAINGYGVQFVVDTGANAVALSAPLAERLGIDFRRRGTRVAVHTAGGDGVGYRLLLDRVRVGQVMVRQVAAVVLDGPHPARPLLGMSFLGRISMRHEGGLLLLRQPR